ncbi:MAG: aminoacetone oxidase family FAD-binding enzyme [Oscillospiraceae bacterium]|nr:aminoacetone oxidase family FAD-binding enzyme [Oscillospiraceae bacterium]
MAKSDFKHPYDVIIVGGGAAGLAASIFIMRQTCGVSTAILEKSPRTGRKLLATGNGTCNLSNFHTTPACYHGDLSFAKHALNSFLPEKTCEFFNSIGVECTVRENGRIYPICKHAGAVLDCLRLEMAALGAHEICDAEVLDIEATDSAFKLKTATGYFSARYVLVCTGGMASPSLGGSPDAYRLLTSLGHTRTTLFPSIVQVRTDTQFIKALKGIRVDASISFLHEGRCLAEYKGEILFTEYGLSGPAVMQISRAVAEWELKKQGRMVAVIDLIPQMDYADLIKSLRRRLAMPGRTMGDVLTGLLQKRVGQTVIRSAGFSLNMQTESLSDGDIELIAKQIKQFKAQVLGTRGMAGAQVTAGGISTAEFNPTTMQSKIVPNLYAAGEVLNVDGDCGGFNLQWAWASANLASKAIVKSLQALS